MNAYATSSHASYRESAILTAPPEQLVIMLYDGCHRFLLQATSAMRDGNVAEAGERLGRATAIIDELQCTLDLGAARPGEAHAGRRAAARAARGVGAGSDVDGARAGRVMGVYDDLLALIEREHALVVAGEWEELAALDARRRDVVARLPAVAPAAVALVLERAAAVQARTSTLLAGGADELRRELGALSQGRVAVRGYGGATAVAQPPARARLDLAG
ncbi:hypothetical protein ABVK25_012134 [Lepraria finkii]|uniref:Flagellar protein FlgN n=1 Tax=Lepraria finkii TaxID=1340010 RepID=A0ABR4AL71_9LECA